MRECNLWMVPVWLRVCYLGNWLTIWCLVSTITNLPHYAKFMVAPPTIDGSYRESKLRGWLDKENDQSAGACEIKIHAYQQ